MILSMRSDCIDVERVSDVFRLFVLVDLSLNPII